MKKEKVKLEKIENFKDLNFGHLVFVEGFAKHLLEGKGAEGFNQKVFDRLIDVVKNDNGDIVLTIKAT